MLKLYDFICMECANRFEKLTETKTHVECPQCGSTRTVFQHAPQAVKAYGLGVHDTKMRTK